MKHQTHFHYLCLFYFFVFFIIPMLGPHFDEH